MALHPPFLDSEAGGLDVDQILAEAIPIAYLIGSFVAVALVPFTIGYLLGPSTVGIVFVLAGQFVLAVGTGVVLLYVVTRALQLAGVAESDG